MRGSSFGYLIKEGFRNIAANRMLSLAAIGVLVACLLLVGTSMLFTLNINSIVGYVESQNEVVVFLRDELSAEQMERADNEIRALPNIASVTFVSREEGLVEWMDALGDDGTLLEWLLTDNPLPNSYRLVIKDLSNIDETLMELRSMDWVETVSAPIEVAQTVAGLKEAVRLGGAGIILILSAVSVAIVANTIKITIFNRRREISIMKYVGATDAFIRLPFVVEGILLGLISATIAFFLLWGAYSGFVHWVNQSTASWTVLLSANLVTFGEVAGSIYLTFAAAGVSIGAVGTLLFTGKYVKV